MEIFVQDQGIENFTSGAPQAFVSQHITQRLDEKTIDGWARVTCAWAKPQNSDEEYQMSKPK
jgi:hypothetical protein